MGKKLYVGNLSYDTSSSDLEQLVAAHGTVVSAEVIMDRATGRSKGFGFVEMESESDAQAAIEALNGQMHGGRALTVNAAPPRAPRSVLDSTAESAMHGVAFGRPPFFCARDWW